MSEYHSAYQPKLARYPYSMASTEPQAQINIELAFEATEQAEFTFNELATLFLHAADQVNGPGPVLLPEWQLSAFRDIASVMRYGFVALRSMASAFNTLQERADYFFADYVGMLNVLGALEVARSNMSSSLGDLRSLLGNLPSILQTASPLGDESEIVDWRVRRQQVANLARISRENALEQILAAQKCMSEIYWRRPKR